MLADSGRVHQRKVTCPERQGPTTQTNLKRKSKHRRGVMRLPHTGSRPLSKPALREPLLTAFVINLPAISWCAISMSEMTGFVEERTLAS
eukprot:1154086-Pelagomonas_calceolata.AAC.2